MHFRVCANQFHKSSHLDANHLFAVCMLYPVNGFNKLWTYKLQNVTE